MKCKYPDCDCSVEYPEGYEPSTETECPGNTEEGDDDVSNDARNIHNQIYEMLLIQLLHSAKECIAVQEDIQTLLKRNQRQQETLSTTLNELDEARETIHQQEELLRRALNYMRTDDWSTQNEEQLFADIATALANPENQGAKSKQDCD